jgi:hypothetical protein
MPRVGAETISGAELRTRIKALGLTNAEAATRLGITEDGLYKAMAGTRRVGRQTELLLEYFEEFGGLTGTGRRNRRLSRIEREQEAQRAAEEKLDRKTRRRRA